MLACKVAGTPGKCVDTAGRPGPFVQSRMRRRVCLLLLMCLLAFRAEALWAPPLRPDFPEHTPMTMSIVAGSRPMSNARHTRLWARAGLVAMRLRGAGDEMDTGMARGGEANDVGTGELFDALLQECDRVGFLADQYLRGDAAMKEQAVNYMTLMMSEEGFLDNMTPLQLLQLCIRAPDLLRACAQSLPEADTDGDAAPGPLEDLLAGLPEAIDALSLRALLKYTNSTLTKDLVGLPAGACVQDAMLVLLECPALLQRITAADMWSKERTEHTLLGMLLRRSPMEARILQRYPCSGFIYEI